MKFFPKCPLKSRLSSLKFKNNSSINMQTWVIEMSIPKSHMYIIYIFNSLLTFDDNLHTVQGSSARWKKFENRLFSLFLHVLKCKVSWQTLSLLISTLFEKHNRLFSYFSVLNCMEGGSNRQGWVFPKNILKWGSHNKMTLREYWEHTIKWEGW